ncbi:MULTISPECIES: lipocalin-like domain-containing protein [Nostocales]|nr:lipocalin-like domain-containing protein [Tolypothrix bouteillei]KAF3886037.1 lipocalin-like domain-containing protein [Tolypothrix bouteillei VB521301]
MSAESNPLLGTWKLISITATYPDGTSNSEAYGENPRGYITYTDGGRMMVLFSTSDRKPFSRDILTPLAVDLDLVSVEERAQAFSTFNAYAGTYTLNGNTVTHDIEVASIPNRVGKDLVRTFTVNGNQVTLKTQPIISNGTLTSLELVWERLEA